MNAAEVKHPALRGDGRMDAGDGRRHRRGCDRLPTGDWALLTELYRPPGVFRRYSGGQCWGEQTTE